MKNLYYFLIAIIFVMPVAAFADNPSITSFVTSVNSLSSGQAVDFAWMMQNAGGYSLILPCSLGVTYKDQNLAALTCGTRISSTLVVNTTFRVYVTNISGGSSPLAVRLIPKDAGGQDYDAASQTVTITVNTTQTPITSFSSSATTTTPGQPVTLQWTTQDVTGANMQIACTDGIHATSPSYTSGGFVPCDAPIFSPDLSAPGSVSLLFSNSSLFPTNVGIRLLPSISSGSYDGTHAATLSLTVASDILPDPVVSFFDASSTVVDSGATVPFAWTVANAKKINMQLVCGSGVTVARAESTSTPLACAGYAFNPDLDPNSNFKLVFQNTTNAPAVVTLALVPSKQIGQYDATRGKSMSITVRPVVSTPVVTSPLVSTSSPTVSPVTPSNPVISTPSVQNKIVFTQILQKGSRGSEVSKLQEFLKRDAAVYPEGIVNGTFGPATERAVQRFQIKYAITKKGIVGYGMIGPKTRSKLNALQ